MIKVSPALRRAAAERLQLWAISHPEPDDIVLMYRQRGLTPQDIVVEVAEGTDLGRMFLHSLYTSYLGLLAGQQRDRTPHERDRQVIEIMEEKLHSDEYVDDNDVDVEVFLYPIEQMILNNRRSG